MALRIARPMRRSGSRSAYYRQRIPSDLKDVVPGRQLVVHLPPATPDGDPAVVVTTPGAEVKFSLRVPESHPAYRVRFAAAMEQTSAWFESLRRGPKKITHRQRVALAGEIYRLWTETLEEDPILLPTQWQHISDAQRSEHEGSAFALMIGEDAKAEERKRSIERRYGRLVDWVLAKHGLIVDRTSRWDLLEEVARHGYKATEKLARNAEGDYRTDTYADRFPAFESQPARSTGTSVTWDLLLKTWERLNNPRETTVRQWNRSVREFATFCGTEDAKSVTKHDVRRWRDHLKDKRGLSSKTINDSKLAALNAVFRAAVREDLLPSNPAAGINFVIKPQPKTKMRAFTDEEAAAILRAALKETNPLRHWVPLLMAQSGARVGEICQLKGSDICSERGIIFFWVRQEVKTTSGDRRVPLHPEVIGQGFLEFVAGRGDGPLFFDPEKRKTKRPHKVLTKDLATWVRNLDLDVGRRGPRKDPNHAWRHWFVTVLRSHLVPDYVIRAIVGHAGGGVTGGYGTTPLPTMVDAISKVDLRSLIDGGWFERPAS